ncbi:2,3-diphosphoglycerate-dependent phosphoglycerate mutase [Amycolatopsis sp. GM8]|uniref:2,3-bisphosphoglycerate-dependent phosphoglycerate mutase n=1 Tax=Amycolatopsis sp. GM8 TaxID=2896530 RepID=UPI001F02D9F8|nr:2,3-bisphosphoglycerate-dependent phosphoglycerate mutase [Amycolatopsis sp. GM8]
MSPKDSRALVLLRHGQSTANAGDRFGGWLDFALTDRGRHEAAHAGKLLAAQDLVPGVVHTSLLSRAVETAVLAMATLGSPLHIRRSWRLNERHYGRLQGRSRKDIRAEFGDEAFARWRRSYEHAPPALAADDPDHPRFDPRYSAVPAGELPGSESLADVRVRLVPYWQESIVPDLAAGRVPLVVAHGNSLRALCMHLDGLTPEEVTELNIPTGVPLHYELDHDLRPLVRGGRYLDPALAAEGVAEVLAQGRP